MRCLFCKEPSDASRSVEHIVPESVGNKRRVLPPGAVCDRCNNYFSRKVEGPLLSHKSMRNLRAWYRVPNKRGTLPSLAGFIAGTDIDIALNISPEGIPRIRPERGRDSERWKEYLRNEPQSAGPDLLLFPLGIHPPQREMSRFLAKMALEALWLRFSFDHSLIERLIDDPHYDRIRIFARSGDNFNEWPYHQRRVYPEETLMQHPTTSEWVQAGFGYDVFITKRPETYFAFCLYGLEFVINLDGPSIKGYEMWLENHAGISPLIERIGLRVVTRIEDNGIKYYLLGPATDDRGRDFDRAEVEA